MKFCPNKLVFGAAHGENLVILANIVLIQYSSVTDRQTDTQAMAKMCETFHRT